VGIALALLAIPCLAFSFPPHDVSFLAIVGLSLLCGCSMLINRPLYAAGLGLVVGLAVGFVLIGFGADSSAYANMTAIFGGVGLALGVTCWLVSWSHRRLSSLQCWLFIPCAAVAVEFGSLHLIPVSLALTQHNGHLAMSVAPVTGAWGITWFMWLGASSLALGVLAKPKWLLIVGALIVLGSLLGSKTASRDVDGSVVVAAVQAPDPYSARDETAKLSDGVEFVVWPEQMIAEDDNIVSETARKYHKYIAASFEVKADKGKPYNSARLYGPDGSKLLETCKVHRFGQEVLLYQEGICAPPVDVGKGICVGVPICYDLVYPDVARKLVRAGANILLTPNSDPDAPGFAFHRIHLALVALRAAENSVPIVWSEINGLATIFDSRGLAVAQGPENEVTSITASVAPGRTRTLYTRFGDWFASMCLVPTVVMIALGLRRSRG